MKWTEEQLATHQARIAALAPKPRLTPKQMDVLRLTADALAAYAPAPPKKSKYRNRKTVVDGLTFDSALEAKRYGELKLMEKGGLISNLRLQVPFELAMNAQVVTVYKADFVYDANGRQVIEDTKGILTPLYRLKKKMMRAAYGIEIQEITKESRRARKS